MTKRKGLSITQMMDDTNEDKASANNAGEGQRLSYTHSITHIPLSNLRFNFKNKRTITQLVRFVPDQLAESALATNDPQRYIVQHISDIPRNFVIAQLEKIRSIQEQNKPLNPLQQEQLAYPSHENLYDSINEGVFIGKGICFSNINTADISLGKQIDEFVETVKLKSAAIEASKNGLAELMQVFKHGAMYYLIFGHQRMCYLAYNQGLEKPVEVLVRQHASDHDHLIYTENNSKNEETGFEKLLSIHYTCKDIKDDIELISNTLGFKKSRAYEVKPFIDDIDLILAIKDNNINIPYYKAVTLLSEAKKISKLFNGTRDLVSLYSELLKADRDSEQAKEESASADPEQNKPNKLTKEKLPAINVSLPTEKDVFQKIMFSDVRGWSKLDVNSYDFSKKKDLKRYFNDLVNELTNE